ncbi:MAG: M23 family metallopeptidase [Alistipes sp.]|nr:M23 family metallopeptidase [Alistipes sp.]
MSRERGKKLRFDPREWSRGARMAFRLFVAMIIAATSNILISSWTDTPKMSNIRRENKRLEDRYRILQGKIASAERTLSDLKHRDHYVYRPILGVDTLNIPEVYSDYLDTKYEYLTEDEYYGDVTRDAWVNLDRLMRKIYYASLSLDATQKLAQEKAEYSSIIPSIWPIDRTKLRKVSSLFGMRHHPTLDTWRMHDGVDLTAPIGTSVYATADGTISLSRVQGGYGDIIEINHGHGYTTRYAHLSARYVSEGDKVMRGQVIGDVGNTGTSTGPHLHYEVRYRNNPVNPVHYFDKDMSEESYKELMEQIESRLNE